MVEILGPDGQPLKGRPAPLKGRPAPQREEQTARLGHLHRELADHPTRGLTPARLAAFYRRAEEGDLTAQAALAQDMEEKDAHLFAELAKRRLAVQGVDWHIEAPPDATPAEEAAAELVKQVLAEIDMADVLYDMTDAVLHAYAGLEYRWRLIDGHNVPTQPELRPPDWFQVDRHNYRYSHLMLRDQSGRGEELRPLNWLLHTQKSRSGYLTRAGLVRVLGWPFLMRALSTRDLAEFLEIYGLPLRLGKYPAGASDAEKSTLLRAVVGIGHAAAGIIPEGMQIEFKEAAAASAGADPFMKMMEWAERSISKAILGSTLTSEAKSTGLGSGLAEVHNEVRKEIAASDRRQLARTIEQQLVRPIVALNTTAQRPPLFKWDDEEPEDMESMANALPGLVDAGLRIPTQWVHDRLKIPMAVDGQEVLARPTQPSSLVPLTQQPPTNAAANNNQASEPPVDALADHLAREAAPALGEIIEQVRAWAAEANSLEALRQRILHGYGDLPSDRLRQIMTTAYAVADATARVDVLHQANHLPEA